MVSRVAVERLSSIDVNQLNRLGAFSGVPMEFPFMSVKTWRYLMRYHPPNWPKERPQRIPISWTRCHFGYGWRPWFLCACGRRCAKLYNRSPILTCRNCAEATYETQRMSRKARLYRKATRIRQRLGDVDGRPGIDPFPRRPPWLPGFGMQRKTYARLRAKGEFIERQLTVRGIYKPCPRRRRWR
jgi:hypothetical protein